MQEIQARPGSRYEYAFGDDHYNHIEYLEEVSKILDCESRATYKHKGMVLMHQVMSRPL